MGDENDQSMCHRIYPSVTAALKLISFSFTEASYSMVIACEDCTVYGARV